jgi:hypothetical protein
VTFYATILHTADYSWQKSHATVTETGSVIWKPKAFVDDLSGQDVRYIDFEGGNDSYSGTSPQTAGTRSHPLGLL